MKTEPLITIAFEVDPHDVVNRQYRISLAPSQVKERWKNIFIATGVAFLLFLLTDNDFRFLIKVLWSTVFAGFIFTLLATAYIWLNKGKHLRTEIEKKLSRRHLAGAGTADLVGERQLAIHESGISIRTNSELTETAWKTLTAIILLPDAILFFLDSDHFFEVPQSKLDANEVTEMKKILTANAPPELFQTRFDYPLS